MKLIDILVQELPNRGGWPIDSDDERTLTATLPGICWGLDGGGYYAFRGPCDSVSHQLYEETLLARKSGWNGEGDPPVGAEVECICNEFPNDGQEKLLGHILYSGEYTILKTYQTNNQHHVPVESVFKTKNWAIIPIRSEADKKRDEAVKAMVHHKNDPVDVTENGYHAIYDAIAAGKIPGIKLED